MNNKRSHFLFKSYVLSLSLCFIEIPLKAEVYNVEFEGATYEIKYFNPGINYLNDSQYFNSIDMPWWGDRDGAKSFNDSYFNSSGEHFTPDGNLGPIFAIGPNTPINAMKVHYYDSSNSSVYTVTGPGTGADQYYAYAELIALNGAAQGYAGIQDVGLDSLDNYQKMIISNAGECSYKGLIINKSKFCINTSLSNANINIFGNSNHGSYDTENFTNSFNLQYKVNNQLLAGGGFGYGTSKLSNYSFNGTTFNIDSNNHFYSLYAVRTKSEIFKLTGLMSFANFNYTGSRKSSLTSAQSNYNATAYSSELNAEWDLPFKFKSSSRKFRIKPRAGISYAHYSQPSFNEAGNGVLLMIEESSANELLVKTGITAETKVALKKHVFVPRLGINYEFDTYGNGKQSRSIKAKLKGSSTSPIEETASVRGEHQGTINAGIDFYLTKRLIVNAKTDYEFSNNSSGVKYGLGFNWLF